MKKLVLTSFVAITLSGCASFPTSTELTSTAEKLGTDALGYAETLAKAIQTVNTGVQTAAPVLEQIAAEWGLLPANSKQLAIFKTVVTDSAQASGDAAALNALLTPVKLQTVVAATP